MLTRVTKNLFAYHVSVFLNESQRQIKGNTLCRVINNGIHTTNYQRNDKNKKPSTMILHSFANIEKKEKNTYLDILRQYKHHNPRRHGDVQFIQVALKYMDDFGVSRDLAVYKALLDVLPKGKYLPINIIQSMFQHYPKQQEVAIELLCKMEHNCVIPDVEVQELLLNIFGIQSGPIKKLWRMLYWMPKFANLNPWPCSRPAPKDPKELARLAIQKICSVDPQTKITDFETKDIKDSIDDTWIVSGMSITQERLLLTQSVTNPLFVEGPCLEWVADKCIDYFILRGEARKSITEAPINESTDDVSNIKIPFWDKQELIPAPTVHEQMDGTYFAMCATGTSTKDSLLSWIRCLQKQNPILNTIPIIFKLASATKDQFYIDGSEDDNKIVQKNN